MGIFDIIKKIFGEEKQEVIKQEFVYLEELPRLIEDKEKQINQSREKLKEKIKLRINEFSREIKESTVILQSINLENKKEEEKIKLLVKENLKLYIDYINRLIENFKKSEELGSEEYILKINQLIENFNKSSKIAYEKATILVGEIEKYKNIFNNFTRDLKSIYQTDSQIPKQLKTISLIKNQLKEKEIIKEEITNIEIAIKEKEITKNGIEKLIEVKEKGIKDFNISEEFKENNKKKQEIEKKKQEIERELGRTKEKINLKELARKYHESEKLRNLISGYQENFKQALELDSNLELEKISEIKLGEIREEIMRKYEKTETDIKLSSLQEELEKTRLEIERINREISQEKERKEKIQEKIGEIDKEIVNSGHELNIEIR